MSWFNKLNSPDLAISILYDEHTFYKKFIKDLLEVRHEVIIESPFITTNRMEILLPIFKKMLEKGVKTRIHTKDPKEYEDEYFRNQATNEILECIDLGMHVELLAGNFHRKLAIIDSTILWEGSLNILSQNSSQEIMRRIEDAKCVNEIHHFLDSHKLI